MQIGAAGGPDRRLLVVDDDATGSQAVHDVSILLSFDVEQLAEAFRDPGACAFVLTNSRSLDPGHAARLNREIGTAALEYCNSAGLHLSVISRSDSTLRGHLFGEVRALNDAHRAVMGRDYDGVLLAPAYFEAGRVTVGDTHWARVAGQFVPVGRTEFAGDATFGYSASDLREFIAEKSAGEVRASDVVSIGIEDIRAGGPERVTEILTGLKGLQFAVVNASGVRRLRGRGFGGDQAGKGGKILALPHRTLICTRPGRARGEPAIVGGANMARQEASWSRPGGSRVAHRADEPAGGTGPGSSPAHRGRAGRQLGGGGGGRGPHVDDVAGRVAAALQRTNVLLITSRSVVSGGGQDDDLACARLVSEALTDALAPLEDHEPAWVIAKGGITSHDVAVQGFGIRRAVVVGQLGRGIISVFRPVAARPGAVGMPYVVFAGNVGSQESLSQAIDQLEAGK